LTEEYDDEPERGGVRGRLTCGGELARTVCEPGRTRHRGLLEAIRSDEDEEEPEEVGADAVGGMTPGRVKRLESYKE
jgi:hypothetical protein